VSEKYALIDAEEAVAGTPFTVTIMCAALGVSRSGFYEARSAPPSARALRRAKVEVHVRAAFGAGRGSYGVRRVHAIVTRSDDPEVASASLSLVRDLMAVNGLRACQPRAYRVTTLRDDDAEPVITDHVNRDFTAPAPGTTLVGDITYIRTWQGWLYLATVIDCHTRCILGWSMASHLRTSLICDALTMAAGNAEFTPGVVFHSDRGTQYTSAEFAKHLKGLKVTASMGRTGVCWDNALAESFFAALKNELVYRTMFATRDQARLAIAEYIEVFYNRTRLHSGIGYKTPAEAAALHRQNVANAA
jgi:putative transposase